jgi:aminotransferase EvaB
MSSTAPAIRMFDYVEQYESMRDEILSAVSEVLASGTLILGPQVQRFEAGFAAYLGGGYGVGVGNGTDALAIALAAAGVGEGDEVITVANTAIPTVSAIRMRGALPLFCEIDPGTLLVDLDRVEACITSRTRAILPVHLYGNAVDMPRLVALARRHGLAVVEDCAQACGTTIDGQPVGTLGDVGCFSFYPTKNLGAYGDGGMCFTRRPDLADAMRQLRAYGCGESYHAVREGVNSRLDELQAAVLNVKLRYLPGCLARRRAVADVYLEHLDEQVLRPRATPGANHSYHLFVIRAPWRDRLIERLAAEQVGCGIHYPVPIHRMRAYRCLQAASASLAHTETAAAQVVSLPCYPELAHDDVRRVCRIVNEETRARI